jgi:hypothetical protein
MDVGSTLTGFSFAALSSHFINKDFGMRERLLRISYFQTPHTGIAILNKLVSDVRACFPLYSAIDEKSLGTVLTSITRDCVSSNNVAMRGTKGVIDVQCMGHRLKTLIDHVERLPTGLVNSMFTVLDFIKRSTMNKEELKNVQLKRLSNLQQKTHRDVVKFPCNLPRTR